MEKQIYDSLIKKSLVKKLLKDKKTFQIKVEMESIENRIVVGILSPTDNNMEIIQFFNSIDNTIRNFLLSITAFLDESDEVILAPIDKIDKTILNDILNPYNEDKRYFHLENAIIRLGSLWDQLAHLCNIKFDLGLDKKSVSANKVFKNKKNAEEYLLRISKYLSEENDFYGFSVHDRVIKIRNSLVHYCDFNALKFLSNYMFESNYVAGFPIGYHFSVVMYDYIKFIEFVDELYDNYLSQKE